MHIQSLCVCLVTHLRLHCVCLVAAHLMCVRVQSLICVSHLCVRDAHHISVCVLMSVCVSLVHMHIESCGTHPVCACLVAAYDSLVCAYSHSFVYSICV